MARIMIIDDDQAVCESLGAMMSAMGHSVCLATDGRDGLRQLPAFGPHLVITDILMPEMEGMETIRALRRLQPNLPIIAMSGREGYWDMNHLKAAVSLGADRSMAKPISPAILLGAVCELLAKKPVVPNSEPLEPDPVR